MSGITHLLAFVAGALSAMIGMVATLLFVERIARDDPDDMADKRHEADQILSRSQGNGG